MNRYETFCRYCHAYCPMTVDVEDGRVSAVHPDTDNDMYGGYTCIKGRQLVEQMYQEERVSGCYKQSDGGFEPIGSDTAMDEIAARLKQLIARHGPRAVATYNGTYAFQNSAQLAYSRAWHNALGSPSYYTSVTIDQPAKVFVGTRHGFWGAGAHFFDDADVALILGNNPMVSQYAPPGGVPSVSPFEKLRNAKKRGLKLIAVDPRSTELSRRADLHLQIKPGEGAAFLAGVIRLILAEGLHDRAFCEQYTEGLDQLRVLVEPFTLAFVAGRTDLPAQGIAQAARTFATASRGVAITGTGPEMSNDPNLTQHLVASLNSLCGRYYREGETLPNPGVLAPPAPCRAQPVNVPLAWGTGARSRIKPELGELTVMGMVGPSREMPTNLLADEILTPGEGQVKALIVVGGNPLTAFANQEKVYRALKELDLLICIDAYMSATARIADYVFGPKLTLERDDVTLLADPWYEQPYSQYAEAVIATDQDVIEEWELFWGLGRRLGLEVKIGKTTFAGDIKPSKFEVLSAITAGSRVPLEWLRNNPGGHTFPEHRIRVAVADPDNTGKLQFAPADLARDFHDYLHREAVDARFSHRLICSRSKYVLNSSGLNLTALRNKMGTTNPAYIHPQGGGRMSHKPFRFGLQAFNPKSAAVWHDMVRKTEDLGYSSYHLADHFFGPGPNQEASAHPPQLLGAMPAIAMALEMTDAIKVGCRVFCMDYREPIILAKEAATLDYLSDGRLELGLGAGWIKSEYEAVNIPFMDIQRRLDKFEEVVHGVKAFMGGRPLDIDGAYLKWQGFSGIPARPRCPPIMIGGGSKRVLTIAGREADIVSLNFNNRAGVLGPDGMASGLADQTEKKIGWIRDGAGDRFNELEIEIGAYMTVVTDQQEATARAIAEPFGMPVDTLLAGPHNLIGSVDYICEELQRRREKYGISYITVLDDGANNMVEQFAPVVAKLADR